MQTFLADSTFKACAEVLDNKRLNKQRLECLQIYNACTGIRHKADGTEVGPAIGWRTHPAVRMWKRYEAFLCMYAVYISAECDARGIADNHNLKQFFTDRMLRHEFKVPSWWYNLAEREKIIHTHRCNLVRKDFNFYSPRFPSVHTSQIYTTQYYWPNS